MSRRLRFFALALALTPPLIVLALVLRLGVDVPFWDEWYTPGRMYEDIVDGTLSLAQMAATHNESRLFFPKLICLALAPFIHWHPKVLMVISWAVTVTAILLLPRLQSKPARTAAWLLVAWPLMSAMIENLAQWQSHMNGMQLAAYIPPLCLVLALLLQRGPRRDGPVFAGCALLSLVANYSFANGFIVWVLAFPWLRARRATWPWMMFYTLAFIISLTLFLYHHPAAMEHAGVTYDAHTIESIANYFLAWIAGPFCQRRAWYPWAPFAGTMLAVVTVAVLAFCLRDARQGRMPAREIHPWLMLAGFALMSGALAAQGRIEFGLDSAMSSRYAAFAIWLPVGLLGLASLSSLKAVQRGAMLLATAGVIVSWTGSTQDIKDYHFQMRQNLLTCRLTDLIPDNPQFANLFGPNASVVPRVIRHLRPAGYTPFDAPEKKIEAALARPARDPAGYFGIRAVNTNLCILHGWTRIPDRARPADFVVLEWADDTGVYRPYTASLVGHERPDVAKLFHEDLLLRCGFNTWIAERPLDPAKLRAFAIDEQRGKAFPLRPMP